MISDNITIIMRLSFIKISYLLIAIVASHTIAEYSLQQEYQVPRNEFFVILLNTTELLESKPITLTRSKHDYSLLPVDDAELPAGWNYLITESERLIVIYGHQDDQNINMTELELTSYDSSNSEAKTALIRLHYYDRDHTNRLAESDYVREIEFAFNNVDLANFFFKEQHSQVNSLFHDLIWPSSRLVEVNRIGQSDVLIRVRNVDSPESEYSIDKLEHEIDLATRNGTLRKLCRSRRSKALSIEHYFRSLGLFPNWCMFKTRRIKISKNKSQ